LISGEESGKPTESDSASIFKNTLLYFGLSSELSIEHDNTEIEMKKIIRMYIILFSSLSENHLLHFRNLARIAAFFEGIV
jgi:hypothetical protein